jgi:hypothetical protein
LANDTDVLGETLVYVGELTIGGRTPHETRNAVDEFALTLAESSFLYSQGLFCSCALYRGCCDSARAFHQSHIAWIRDSHGSEVKGKCPEDFTLLGYDRCGPAGANTTGCDYFIAVSLVVQYNTKVLLK